MSRAWSLSPILSEVPGTVVSQTQVLVFESGRRCNRNMKGPAPRSVISSGVTSLFVTPILYESLFIIDTLLYQTEVVVMSRKSYYPRLSRSRMTLTSS